LTEREVEELRGAMEFYDSNIKTGNEVLDVVLRLSQLTCEKEHIQLSCLADGSCLNFMRTRHVYSLFNNAIGNAIEAVRKLTDEDKRVISISVSKHGERAEIEITNYFDGRPVLAGDTSKEDRSHHGFGTMSMRYVVEEYGGNLSIQTQKDIFTLFISIPFSG
jgi:sensor histidine kinase regulating citrate/malate metabolism